LQTKYLFAESLGVFGGSLAFTALGLLLGLEGTPWALALLAALPYLTLPLDLLAGLLLDRLDRRTLLLVGVWLRAGILGLLAFLPKEPLFLLPLAFLFQAVLALDLPAWHALLVRLARDRLEREGGRLQAAQLLGDSLGDLLAAPLLLLAKPLPFALGGLLLAGGGLLLRDLPAYPPPRAAKGEGFTLGALFAGLAFLLGDGRLLPLTLYALAISFLSGLALALLPLVALAQGAPPALYGLYPWGLSIGGFLGSLLAGRIGPCLGVWSGHGLRILGLALLLLPFPFGPLGTFLAGMGGALGGVHLRAYRQRLAPEPLLGRVQAGSVALLSSGSLLGILLAGGLGGLNPGAPLLAALLGLLLLLPLALGPLGCGRLLALREGRSP
jgi:ENTS family enterobactin (siderophore) exporter